MDCVRRRGKVYCAVITVPSDMQFLIRKKQLLIDFYFAPAITSALVDPIV